MPSPPITTLPGAEMEIPREVARLHDLAYNLWWTWSPPAHRLFSSIDPARWVRSRNPVELLLGAEPHVWDPLLMSESFMGDYHAVVGAFDRYLEAIADSWFHKSFPAFAAGPVAYLSTEFGWHESLGIYSGGLGVLSGDHCKSASDLGIPFVGVGLMYRRGYFRQSVSAEGDQQHFYPDYDVRKLPIRRVAGPGAKPLRVPVELPGRTVQALVWKATVGRVPVLLLDTDLRENDPADRPITSILYVHGREMRLCQEMVLGVGGARALAALGIVPSVWHLNEGHSALVAFERIRREMERGGLPHEAARAATARNAVFTTHTPVPAGNETFDVGLVEAYAAAWAGGDASGTAAYVGLGKARPDDRDFNMTVLALRTSGRANGVSRLHGQVAERMWGHLGATPPAAPIGAITNGVHVPTWLGPEMGELLGRHLGRDFADDLLDPGFADAVLAIPDEEVWDAHVAQKGRLVALARERVLQQLARHGRSPESLRRVQSLLDPDALTIGFARRFATYKRADLVFRDLPRLAALVNAEGRPVQILFAGKAHPADRPGQAILRRIFEVSTSPEFWGRVVLLENYDMRIARFLVQGVDVWANTPRRPLEASGTSGMKAAVNGAIHASVLDGWWAEGYDPTLGWAIGDTREHADAEEQDRTDAASLYAILADEIVPAFYERDVASRPSGWIARMKRSIARLTPRFSTARMVRDYAVGAYLPAMREADPTLDEARLWSP